MLSILFPYGMGGGMAMEIASVIFAGITAMVSILSLCFTIFFEASKKNKNKINTLFAAECLHKD